jgi:diguanylate cyclase (GGDEF)-like protein
MLRRAATVGGPPLFLVIGTLLLVRYHPLLLQSWWGGELPGAWDNVVRYLPLLLAAVGVVVGLRMGSCGIMMVMLTLGAAFGTSAAGVISGWPGLGTPGRPPDFFLVMPLFLLGLWTLRHSWRTRRGLTALAGALVVVAGTTWMVTAGRVPTAAIFGRFMDGARLWPAAPAALMQAWGSALPAVVVILVLVIYALRKRDPAAAAMGASLVLLLPPVFRGLDGLSRVIVFSAAVLVVLVGALESMLALAYRDGLTGLPGRRALNDALRQLGRRYAIAMLDVDHFKRFNDRFGHRTGDDVLKMIAARLLRIPGGRAYRYGGEEFAVIFRGRSARHAAERMEALRETLARTPFVIRHLPRASRKARGGSTARMHSRKEVRITASIGWAAPALPQGRRKPAEVLAAADKALYRAKQKGRNRVAAADTMTKRTRNV